MSGRDADFTNFLERIILINTDRLFYLNNTCKLEMKTLIFEKLSFILG